MKPTITAAGGRTRRRARAGERTCKQYVNEIKLFGHWSSPQIPDQRNLQQRSSDDKSRSGGIGRRPGLKIDLSEFSVVTVLSGQKKLRVNKSILETYPVSGVLFFCLDLSMGV